MAHHKRQHYVPQFYLREFSEDGINLFGLNIENLSFFCGPIRTMCAESYFYGQDVEMEKSFSQLEGKASEIILKIRTTKRLPTTLEEKFFLLSFMMLQRGRTAAARDSAKRQTQKFSEMVTQAIGITDYRLVWKADHSYAMLVNFAAVPLIIDLKMVLIINNTKMKFIVSDNPVIFHNSRFNKIKSHGVNGFQSNGLQIFWPISPTLCLLLYDEKYYQIEEETDQSIPVFSDDDVQSINVLQYLYSREIVLFTSRYDEECIKKIDKQFRHLRKKETEIQRTYPHPTKHNAKIVHFYRQSLDYDLSLSFITITDGPEYGIRDMARMQEYKKFFDRLMNRNRPG